MLYPSGDLQKKHVSCRRCLASCSKAVRYQHNADESGPVFYFSYLKETLFIRKTFFMSAWS